MGQVGPSGNCPSGTCPEWICPERICSELSVRDLFGKNLSVICPRGLDVRKRQSIADFSLIKGVTPRLGRIWQCTDLFWSQTKEFLEWLQVVRVVCGFSSDLVMKFLVGFQIEELWSEVVRSELKFFGRKWSQMKFPNLKGC